MKKITVTTLFALACLVTAGSALAENAHELRANVPFNFSVGDKVLPAGNYRIDRVDSKFGDNLILIQNSDQLKAAILTPSDDATRGWTHPEFATGGRLIFAHYGSQYFLHGIRGPAASVNVDFPTSKAEKNARLHEE